MPALIGKDYDLNHESLTAHNALPSALSDQFSNEAHDARDSNFARLEA